MATPMAAPTRGPRAIDVRRPSKPPRMAPASAPPMAPPIPPPRPPSTQADDGEDQGQRAGSDRERPDLRRHAASDQFPERRPAAVGQVEAEDRADHDPDDGRDGEARVIRPPPKPSAARTAAIPMPIEEQGPVEQCPAHGSEDPLVEPQEQPDPQEQPGEQQDADGDADEDRDLADLAADLADLGLCQVDVGADQPLECSPGRAYLVTQAGRGLVRPRAGGSVVRFGARLRPWRDR